MLRKEADAQFVGADHAAMCDLQTIREHFRQGRFAFAVAPQKRDAVVLVNAQVQVAMVLIGASFTLRHQRGGRTGLMVLYAILLSFAIYFLRNFAQVLGENGQLPAILAAWAPPLAAIGLSLGILLHNEDG